MDNAIKTIEFADGSTLKIFPDEYPESPRNWDNLSQMVCFHKRYKLGDDHSYDCEDFNNWSDLQARIGEDNDLAVILPLYLLDHSGITISTKPFSCPWDSGQVGFVFVTKQKMRENWNLVPDAEVTAFIGQAIKTLIAEVETYDQYLRGDVFGYVHKDANGKHLDSCWGFFGDIETSGMLENFSEEYQHEIKASL